MCCTKASWNFEIGIPTRVTRYLGTQILESLLTFGMFTQEKGPTLVASTSSSYSVEVASSF
eukprot:428398-Rhodomonas_salina.1